MFNRWAEQQWRRLHLGHAAVLGAGLAPLLIGGVVHRQGFTMLDDGLWLLGAKVLSEGGVLYTDIFSIYGPARYILLLPLFAVFGQSGLALAVLKAVTDAVASGLGFWTARRLGAGRWAWLVPVGLIALGPVHPRYVAVGAFALLVAEAVRRAVGWRGGLATGAAWGLLAGFGLDAAIFGGLVVVVSGLATPGCGWRLRGLLGIGSGLCSVLAGYAGLALACGCLSPAVWDTVVYPLTRFPQAMKVSWLQTAFADPRLLLPFADLYTGETLSPAWPGHGASRAVALRILYVTIWMVPLWALWTIRRRRLEPLWTAVAALALAGWLPLLGRGDVAHLRMAWLGSLWLLPPLLAHMKMPRRAKWGLGAVMLILVWSPLLGEKLWLAAHAERSGLATWDRRTARVKLAPQMFEPIEQLFRQLPWDGKSPLLIWPAQPGLHFFMDVPLACSQATLLRGEVRDERSLIHQLQESRPPLALQGTSWGLMTGVSTIQQLVPMTWTYLRRHYAVTTQVRTELDQFRILQRAGGSRTPIPQLPLDRQLPDKEQYIRNASGPVMQPGTTYGQSFRVGDDDFRGISVCWYNDETDPLPFEVRIQLWAVSPAGLERLLASFTTEIDLRQPVQMSSFQFEPVAGTAGRQVAVTFELLSAAAGSVRLACHRPEPGSGGADLYPDGSALLNRRPTSGDLYFMSY